MKFPQRGPEVPTRFLIDNQGNLIIPQIYFIVFPTITFCLANLLISYPFNLFY